FRKNGIAFPFYTRDGTDEICQKLSAKYFIEARNQSIEKETKSMDTRIQRTIDSSRLILSFGSTCLFTKSQTSRTADEKIQYLEDSENRKKSNPNYSKKKKKQVKISNESNFK